MEADKYRAIGLAGATGDSRYAEDPGGIRGGTARAHLQDHQANGEARRSEETVGDPVANTGRCFVGRDESYR